MLGQGMSLDRRQFIVTATAFAGGMALSVGRPARAAMVSDQPWGVPTAAGSSELTPWIAIAPDDTVTIRVTTPEIGNGVMTQTPMTVTEELGCDWSKVRAEFAPAARDYLDNDAYSKGGGAVPYFSGHSTDENRMQVLLQAGASARERLKAAAGQVWKAPVSEISVKDSVLTHTPTGRTLRYGEVAARAATVKLAAEPALKPQSEWTFLGKSAPPKLNLPQIVNGQAVYGIDVRQPGMVYAAIRHSPVHGGKLKSYDAAAVMKLPGIRAVVVLDPGKTKGSPVKAKASFGFAATATQSAVAVIADHYWQAKQALEALPVEWDDGAGAQWKSNDQVYQAAFASLDAPGEKVEKSTGNVVKVSAQKTVKGEYLTPYCEQAPMEPLNGAALVTADRVEVWHPAQDSRQGFWIAVDETGMAPEKVTFNQTFVGGAFGRRVFGGDIRMVVAVAKEYPGVPVQVIWSREEMMRQGRYRPVIASRYEAKLDAEGNPQAMMVRTAIGGYAMTAGLADCAYVHDAVIPNVHIESHAFPIHFLTGPYRAPGYNSFAFMTETFIDECAVAAGVDPLEYRLRLVGKYPDPGWAKCLNVAAEKSDWGKPLPKGTGRGIAIASWGGFGKPQAGTIACVVAKVEVSKAGALKILALDVTFDSGRIVNRDAVLTELQGGTMFGLNMAMNEELTIKDGMIVEGNFDAYPIYRIADIPPITVHFDALTGHDRFGMIGEPPVGPVGPAIGNAIFQATGKRIRSTPFRKHDLSWA